ncbi:hypothetical protein MUO93_11930 [Candidatus Bathyarchaeota archaeon]|nr:hypothetical protein [Candidatus Bathyarchaeota archaeon]
MGVCVEELRDRMRSKDGRVRGSPGEALADLVGVTERTVQRWLANGVQSCNVNAERIVELAVEMNHGEAWRILLEDLARHREEVESVLGEGRHGDVAELIGVIPV